MDTDLPLVSVIIPTYNRAHLVGRAIRSVLNQTYQDFELIVVDDGSTDSTEKVVKGFIDDRIRYIRHNENKGGSAARNSGIEVARGGYVAFQDSDDEWLPEKLEKQLKVFEDAPPDVGVVYTRLRWLDERTRMELGPAKSTREMGGNIHTDLLEGNFIGTPTVLVRRECFDKVGVFDERLPRLQDWELWIRISEYYQFRCLDELLIIAYVVKGSISTNQDAHIKALELIMGKHFEDFSRSRRLLARRLYVLGNLLCQSGEMGAGRDYLLEGVKLYPLHIKYVMAAFASLFGRDAYIKIARLKRRIIPNKNLRFQQLRSFEDG